MDWAPLLLSFQVASAATLLAGVVGIAVAGWMWRGRMPGRELVDVIITAPMVLPPTVLGYYLLLLIGKRSVLGQGFERLVGHPLVFTPTAAVLAATLTALPFVVRSARAAMQDVDPRLLGAAATLGAPPWRVFCTVVLPLSRGGILAGLTLGFARALGDFGVTLMVAGNLPGLTQTASLAIYDAVQAGREGDAAAMAAVMTALAVAALLLGGRLGRARQHGW